MTIVPHGYADWQKVLSRQDTVFVNEPSRSTSGTAAYPVFFCGNTERLQVRLDGNSGVGEVRLFFYMDSAQSLFVGEIKLGSGAGQDIHTAVTPLGPFCLVNVVAGFVAPFSYGLVVSSVAIDSFDNPTTQNRILYSATVVPIGAGATQTFDLDRTFFGKAYWSARVNLGNLWAFVINQIDNAGAVRCVARQSSGDYHANQFVYLPGGYLQGSVTNFEAAARDYDFILIGDPRDN